MNTPIAHVSVIVRGVDASEVTPPQDRITLRQRDLLISLLYQHIGNESDREKWISGLDELSKVEASDQIQFWLEPSRQG